MIYVDACNQTLDLWPVLTNISLSTSFITSLGCVQINFFKSVRMAGIVNKQTRNLNLSNYCNQEKLLNLAVERMFNVSVPYLVHVVHDMIVSLFYGIPEAMFRVLALHQSERS